MNKKIAVALGLSLAALTGCFGIKDVFVLRPSVKAALYVGKGAFGVSAYRWLELTTFADDLDTTLVDAEQIRNGVLDSQDVLIVPDGCARTIASELGDGGADKVREFIRNGGGYVGTGAGALLVSESSASHPKMLNLIPFASRDRAGRADMMIRFSQRAADLMGVTKGTQRIAYAAGPVFTPALPVSDAEFEIVATYESNIRTQTDKELPSMAGQAAVVAGQFGKGAVLASAIEPEVDFADHGILEGAFRFVAGREIKWNIPQRRRGQLAVGIDVEKGFATVASATEVRKLMREHQYDLIPVDADILGAGMGHHLDVTVRPDAEGFAKIAQVATLPNGAFGHVVDLPCGRRRGALSVAIGDCREKECANVYRKGLIRDRRFDVRTEFDRTALKHLDAVVIGSPKKDGFDDALRSFAEDGGTVFVVTNTPEKVEAVAAWGEPEDLDGVILLGAHADIPAVLGALCADPCEQARLVAEAESPDGKNEIRLYMNPLSYEVLRDGDVVVPRTPIDLEVNGKDLASDLVTDPAVSQNSRSGMMPTPVYKKDLVTLDDNETFADFGTWGVRLAARDDGVAWRFETMMDGEFAVTYERAGLTLPPDAQCYAAYTKGDGQEQAHPVTQTAAELRPYDPKHEEFIFMPFVFKSGDTVVCMSESDLSDFPVWNVARMSPTNTVGAIVLESVYGRWPTSVVNNAGVNRAAGANRERQWLVRGRDRYLTRCDGNRTFPWRCFMLADEYAKLCESDLVYALARPNDDPLLDFSWVKPGKVAWEWWNAFDNIGDPIQKGAKNGCTTATYKRFIDFAAKNGIEYVIMDEGWSEKLNIWKFASAVDVPELIRYGNEKGVGIILWMAWAQADGDEERVAEHFAKLGVKGFKVDFMDRGDAQVERFLWKFADACARHKLLVDWHGAHRPTGQHRAYPNIVNYEAVHGLEVMKFYIGKEDFMDNDVKNFFVRMTAGPLDYTPGAMLNFPKGSKGPANYTRPGSFGTRCHQIALMSMFEAPLQMLCDSPTNYEKNQECLDFMAKTPTVWDDVKGLGGTPDTYAAVARKAKDGSWWVSAITNWEKREIEIDTSFLSDGTHEAEMFCDADDCDVEPTHYVHQTMTIDGGDVIRVKLAPGGGAAIRIK